MKTVFLVLLCFCLPAFSRDTEATLYLGMARTEFTMVLNLLEARDITPGMALAANPAGIPWRGLYWEIPASEVILEVAFTDGQLCSLTYWKAKEFNKSKFTREIKRQLAQELTFKVGKKGCKAERVKSPEQALK